MKRAAPTQQSASVPAKAPKPIGVAARVGATLADGSSPTPARPQQEAREAAQIAARQERQKQMQQLVATLDLPNQPFTGQDAVKERKMRVITCLVGSLNIVSTACANAGITHTTFYEYKKTDPAFKAIVDSLAEYTHDFVEQKLFNLIQGGDTAATIFYAKTRMKQRGYVERTEVTGPNGAPLTMMHMTMSDVKQDMPKESLADIYKALLVGTGQMPADANDAAAFFAKGRTPVSKK